MPEVPALSGDSGVTGEKPDAPGTLVARVSQVFAADGPLARNLTAFEPRDGQLEMAVRVARAFEDGGVLLAEAGTGTGKTLAYLVPAILSRQRVLISTGTKNLQEQIYFKDIPALRDALGIPFTATYMKGRANYLCLHRLEQLTGGMNNGVNGGLGLASHDVFLPMVREWSARTETGDRAELEDLPEDLPFWNEVSATAETCLGTECSRYDDCFVTRMRQRAAAPTSSSSTIICCARTPPSARARTAKSSPPATTRSSTKRTSSRTSPRSTSAFPSAPIASKISRATSTALLASGAIGDLRNRHELERATELLRDDARSFFADLAFGHRTGDRPRGEERVRTSEGSLACAGDAAAALTGALDLVEATLALLPKPPDGEAGAATDAARRPTTTRRNSRAGQASCARKFGSCSARAIRSTSISSNFEGRACFSGPRPSTCRPSSASSCWIACARRC